MKKLIIVAISVVLLQHGFAQIKIDRSKKPAAGPAPIVSIKDPVIFTLANGMTVLVVENHKLPKVNASLSIDAGPIAEGKKAGLVELMGQMLGEGTTTMPKDKFDEAVDLIGAQVSLYSGGGGDFPVPTRLAFYPHSGGGHSGLADWYFLRDVPDELHHQRADAAGHRAGH